MILRRGEGHLVGIQDHAVAEAPTGVARALLYIVRASPSFLLHPSYKTFYHTFHHTCSGYRRRPDKSLGDRPKGKRKRRGLLYNEALVS